MRNIKGILLSGGKGSRLAPLTSIISKHLLPVYDKPLIYYPLSVLMMAQIRDIMIISTERDLPLFQNLLHDGSNLGMNISYLVQENPNGIAESLILAEDFIGQDKVSLILGDNIFYGNDLENKLVKAANFKSGAKIFIQHVNDPERFGVVSLKKNGDIDQIIEKPKSPQSNYAVTGLYFYDSNASYFAKKLQPSDRNELEITDLNNLYLKEVALDYEILGKGFAWLDTGTYQSLLQASAFVETLQNQQGIQICCPEEIALMNDWISKSDLERLIANQSSNYYQYLKALIEN